MGKAICVKGHIFDDEKYQYCPYCSSKNDLISTVKSAQESDVDIRNSYTVVDDIYQKRELEKYLTQGYLDEEQESRTIGLSFNEDGFRPVVGWLVCEKGPERGRSYIIRNGRNFVGRSYKMDIIIPDDKSISRDNHFSIIFEPVKCLFYIYPSDSNLTHVNGKIINSEMIITEDDTIEVGKSVFRLIPYCKKGRVWE